MQVTHKPSCLTTSMLHARHSPDPSLDVLVSTWPSTTLEREMELMPVELVVSTFQKPWMEWKKRNTSASNSPSVTTDENHLGTQREEMQTVRQPKELFFGLSKVCRQRINLG